MVKSDYKLEKETIKNLDKDSRATKVGKGLRAGYERLKKIPHRIYTEKALKKPHAKIKPISSKEILKGFTSQNVSYVRPEVERVYANDNRSLFFKEEWAKANKNMIL